MQLFIHFSIHISERGSSENSDDQILVSRIYWNGTWMVNDKKPQQTLQVPISTI